MIGKNPMAFGILLGLGGILTYPRREGILKTNFSVRNFIFSPDSEI